MKNILSHHKNASSVTLKSRISRFAAPAVLFFLLCALGVQGQITGTVFRDFDGDGTRDANEPLIPGITVTAFSAAGTQCGTTTTAGNNAPNYSLTGCGTAAARVEFTIPASGTCATASRDYAALGANVYGSSVQFVNGNSTNVNFGLHDPEDYNQGPSNTTVYVPYYGHGDPTIVGGASGARDWLVGFPYNNSGGTVPSKRLNGNIIGSTWGLAYSKRAKKLFSSAVFHRHIGLGTLGTGGIYITDETAFTTATFYDLDANGYRTRADNTAPAYGLGSSFNFDQASGTKYSVTFQGSPDPLTNQPSGLGVVGSNSARGLVANPSSPSYDPAAFDQAGKVSLGDLEISENEEYLFVINLYTRKLLRLKLNNVAAPTGITEVMEYSLPNITVNNGLLRPWALKFYRGKLYVGAVSTGENGGQNIVNGATDLRAYVFEVTNPTGTLTFNTTPILDQPLNHIKGSPASGVATQWYPWTKTSLSGIVVGLNTVYPQPILSDIEFSDRGDMILAFTDRAGNQYGGGNYIYLGDNATLSYATTGGDIQIAGLNCTTGAYTRENNGQFVSINGETYTGSPNNAQGPGNGEFFHTDAFSIHSETAAGALAVLKGDAKVILTDMDPLNFLSGGTMKLSTTNGFDSDRYQLYVDGITGVTNPGLGKANGLGDIEFGGVLPPLEIGNRIWRDTDSDGIQDAGENGIANVTLELFADFDNDNNPDGAALATTNTAPNGTWYFNAANVTDGDPNLTGNQAGPQPEKQYLVRVGTADWTAGAAVGDLAGLLLTFANIGGAGQPDVRDNDAALLATIPTLVVNTGTYGASNHNYDIGFRAPCIISAITANAGPCVSTTNAHTVTGNITFANPPATGTLTVQIGAFSQTFNAPFTSPTAYSIAGVNSTGTSQTVNAVFSADATCISSITYMTPAACCPAPALICAGESYTLSAQAGLTDYQWFRDLSPISGANSSTYIATQTGSYTWTAVDNQCPIGGCCPLVLNPCICAITVTSATPTACVGNLYNLAVVVTYTNSPGGNITVTTSNGGTITVPATTSPQTITLTGLTANGTANIGVTAAFVATPACTNTLTNAYNAPAACNCTMVVTSATPTACAGNSLYNLAVVVTYTNSPGGNITVTTSNGGTITVAATASPQTITLTGLAANSAANIGVTAAFVATPTCTNTLAAAYNAPAPCPPCPNPNCVTATVVKN